jgi:hypothetical protein
MPAAPLTVRSRLARPLPASFAKSRRTSTSGMWAKALLTAPYPDLAGDVVVPAGIDFTAHRSHPAIDLEHGRDPAARSEPVAWARDTLAEPGGAYALEWHTLDFGEPGAPDRQRVPVGTSYFDKSSRLSTQTFALVEQDALPAVSIEFRAVPGFCKALGRSPLEDRDAYRFDRAELVRWSVCARGVCPHALTLTDGVRKSLSASAPQVPPALAQIVRDGRVNVGGRWEALHPAIAKALGAPPRSATVRVEKSMNDDQLATPAETAAADMPQPDVADAGPPAKPTVQAHYDFAQGLLDLIDQAEAQLESSEHMKGKQFLTKKLEAIRGLAEDVKAMGDKIDGELSAKDEAEPGDDGDEEPVGDEIDTDDEGVMKGIRGVYRKAIKRFRLADLEAPAPTPPPPAPADDEPSPELLKARANFQKWKGYAGVA